MKDWISENFGWSVVIAGAVLGFVYIFCVTRWPEATAAVIVLSAIPVAANLYADPNKKPIVPAALMYACALVWFSFVSGSLLWIVNEIIPG